MLLLHKLIVLLQINLFLISVDCLKKPESNLVLEDKNDNNNKELIEKLLATNYNNPAKQYDIKNTNPQIQVFTDQKTTNNNNNQFGLSKYQNFLNQQNYGQQHNYASKNYHHLDSNPNNKISSPQITAEQKEIIESFKNIRNYQKRDNNNNQTKKPCPHKNKKNDNDDDQPTPTYFYPKHIKGELVVHNPAPIIVKRPPTKVVVNHPAIIVRPQPVLINRTPQAINPVMVYKPPPAPPAEPLKIRPVFVKFESDGSSPSYNGGYPQHRIIDDRYPQHRMPEDGYHHRMPEDGYHHRMPDDVYQHRIADDGYSHRIPGDDDDEKDGLYGEGTNVNFNGSPYYKNYGQQSRYNGYNNYNREYNM